MIYPDKVKERKVLVMEGREVLVTGGTGRLGRRVVDLLRAEGLELRVMSRSGEPGTIKGDLLTLQQQSALLPNEAVSPK